MPVVTVPAPYGGQNNKDGLIALAPQFATNLVNWIPGPGYLDARGPCVQYSDTVGDYITSIWGGGGGGVFTTEGGSIYAVATTIGAALASGLNAQDWHGNSFQNRIILCSGLDAPRIFDGTAITTANYTGSPVGLTPANLYGSLTFKGRAYYWEKNKRLFWYAAAGAFQGALALFDLSTFTRADGTLETIAPLTIDGGSGPDDLIAFIFSNGEVLVYQGDDPSNTNSWQQIGAFRIGRTKGRAAWAVVGSATLVATQFGVIDLARALSTGALDDSSVVGQQFGAVNFGTRDTPLLANAEYKLMLDTTERILWLFLNNDGGYAAGDNFLALYGMDMDSRSWFQIGGLFQGAGRRTTAMGVVGNTVLLGASDSGSADGRLVNAPYRLETLNEISDYFTSASGGSGIINYTASQYFPLDSPDRNKMLTAVAYHMNKSVTSVAPTLTFAVTSDASDIGTPHDTVTYSPNPQTRAFNSCRTYGTAFLLTTTMTSKSAVRWYGTDLLVKPGRQV